MEPAEQTEQEPAKGVGDVWTMLIVNAIFIGFCVALIEQLPFQSREQEFWYRCGSLGLIMAGVVLPAVAIYTIRQSRLVVFCLNAWMSAILIGLLGCGMMLSGGV
ncbi:hypothetical protein [Sphingomonas prati]|uniref:hypothetical protein n=1 Tax=Sphingomonas prati TaxID=1843237 RepID=UPI00161D1E71|nr:hypothetical protein [Sphingomonas prati]